MYNRGISELLSSLPGIVGLAPDLVRRELTRAWADALAVRDQRNGGEPDARSIALLRRMASALELHAVLAPQVSPETLKACAFVAAEALDIARKASPTEPPSTRWLLGNTSVYEAVEIALLYKIAGFDSNAALVGAELDSGYEGGRSEAERALARSLVDFLAASNERTEEFLQSGIEAQDVREGIIATVSTALDMHMEWLRHQRESSTAIARLDGLIEALELPSFPLQAATGHSDIHHLALLVRVAMAGTVARSLRGVDHPVDARSVFDLYQISRAKARPLLWPAAAEYSEKALPGPHSHAVVTVPTGAGKSAVAELAIAQALGTGWVLYLAPTNALVGQIRRQLSDALSGVPGAQVQQFFGGAEYTTLPDRGVLGGDDLRVIVMTPEKCSLALRTNPDAFSSLALCVVDEAHTLGEPGGRAVVLELVMAEVMVRAPRARILALSALIANPDDVTSWLAGATGVPAQTISAGWRPTRTLRAVAGFDRAEIASASASAQVELDRLPARRQEVRRELPLSLLVGLQGPLSDVPADHVVVRTSIDAPLRYRRGMGMNSAGYVNRSTGRLVRGLVEAGEKVLAFLPRNKHHSFTVAAEIAPRLRGVELSAVVRDLLDLADAELGVPSALRQLLAQGVAVHTSAMLKEEQRASELAFDAGAASAMFATGTLAQGLNLPATAVVVGGTEVGYDAFSGADVREARARAQLLNAIGRAGRAHVAARSVAVVVPDVPAIFGGENQYRAALRSAEFLRLEDASTSVVSQLDGLISSVEESRLDAGTLSTAEQTAFAFLSFAEESGDASRVLAKSWAGHRRRNEITPDEVASALGDLGEAYLTIAGSPDWLASAAHRAGVALPRVIVLERAVRQVMRSREPASVPGLESWLDVLVETLQMLSLDELALALPRESFAGASFEVVWDEPEQDWAWRAFRNSLHRWVNGWNLAEVSRTALVRPIASESRSSGAAVPTMIRVASDGFGHELSMLAGALVAIIEVGADSDQSGPWLNLGDLAAPLYALPVALRVGVSTPSAQAWVRAGFGPRTVASILARLTEAYDLASFADLERAIRELGRRLVRGYSPPGLTAREVSLVRAAARVRKYV